MSFSLVSEDLKTKISEKQNLNFGGHIDVSWETKKAYLINLSVIFIMIFLVYIVSVISFPGFSRYSEEPRKATRKNFNDFGIAPYNFFS